MRPQDVLATILRHEQSIAKPILHKYNHLTHPYYSDQEFLTVLMRCGGSEMKKRGRLSVE
jgi:hypothetical protein